MKKLTTGIVLAGTLTATGCLATKEAPTQVVYRFDDHRYLELKGWNCEGELWYTDTQRGIHSQPYLMRWSLPPSRYYAEDRLSFGELSWKTLRSLVSIWVKTLS
ncbi:hypothetical protein ACB382_32270, partial [Klebsiella michiganensis]